MGRGKADLVGVNLFCSVCGLLFIKSKYRYLEAEKQGNKNFYCSRVCTYKGLSTVAYGDRKEEFWKKVNKSPGQGPNGDCWEWQSGRTRKGYGYFKYLTKEFKAHRLSYTLFHNLEKDLSPDQHVLHKCDNPPCCNPDHLFLGTNADNVADKLAKGRGNHGERHGSVKLTERKVKNIRKIYKEGNITQGDLAKKYKVSQGTIYLILNGTNWKHML